MGGPSYTVAAFHPADASAWDELAERSCNGTFLHTRRFLGYHGNRFRDASLTVHDGRGRMVGIFPASVQPPDASVVVSHPGSTYGGLVHDGTIRGEAMVLALGSIAGHLRESGFSRLQYKAVPTIFHRVPSGDDSYALFRLGAKRYRCDLSAVIDLTHRSPPSHGRRSSIKRAQHAGIELLAGWGSIGAFWTVLETSLAERHQSAPVHTLEQITQLHDLFPEQVRLLGAVFDGRLVAGAVLFRAGPVLHAQYLASDNEGRSVSALDLVIEEAIDLALDEDLRYFDFGTSNSEEGRLLNQPLYYFKVSFGAGGVVHEYFEMDLERAPAE